MIGVAVLLTAMAQPTGQVQRSHHIRCPRDDRAGHRAHAVGVGSDIRRQAGLHAHADSLDRTGRRVHGALHDRRAQRHAPRRAGTFAAGGRTVDRIPADLLVRRGVTINVERQASANDDYQVTVDDIKADETTNGAIPEGALVLIASGWDKRWPDATRYRNERGGVMHFPGLSVAAAEYLVGRKVAGVAIDTPSVDYGPSKKYEVHHTTMPGTSTTSKTPRDSRRFRRVASLSSSHRLPSSAAAADRRESSRCSHSPARCSSSARHRRSRHPSHRGPLMRKDNCIKARSGSNPCPPW